MALRNVYYLTGSLDDPVWCECCHENRLILAAQILTNVGQFLSLIPLLGWWRGRNCPSCIRTCLKCSAGGCCWLESLNIKYSIIFLHLMFSCPDVCLFVDWVNVEGWCRLTLSPWRQRLRSWILSSNLWDLLRMVQGCVQNVSSIQYTLSLCKMV